MLHYLDAVDKKGDALFGHQKLGVSFSTHILSSYHTRSKVL